MTEHEVPLYMNGKVIGRISVNRETGEFSGAFDPELMPILREGMDAGSKSVTFDSLYGLFAHAKLNPQQRMAAYLERGTSLRELEERHCGRYDTHNGHEWASYYCLGNVDGPGRTYYTLREATGDHRVLRKNVIGLDAAMRGANDLYNVSGVSVAWVKQSSYIDD